MLCTELVIRSKGIQWHLSSTPEAPRTAAITNCYSYISAFRYNIPQISSFKRFLYGNTDQTQSDNMHHFYEGRSISSRTISFKKRTVASRKTFFTTFQ